jgi:hypothetical protein
MSPPLGSLRLERISLTSAFFVLAYVLIFFAFSRVGLVDGRNVLAIAGASAGAWGLLHVTRSPRAFVHVARRVGSRRAFRLGRWPAPGRKHRGGSIPLSPRRAPGYPYRWCRFATARPATTRTLSSAPSLGQSGLTTADPGCAVQPAVRLQNGQHTPVVKSIILRSYPAWR